MSNIPATGASAPSLIPSNITTARMTSREIADLTGKEHFNVMRDIRDLIDQGAINAFSFELVDYKDAKGEKRPMYSLDFKSTMVLITGYDANRRSMVIDRWMALETGEKEIMLTIAGISGNPEPATAKSVAGIGIPMNLRRATALHTSNGGIFTSVSGLAHPFRAGLSGGEIPPVSLDSRYANLTGSALFCVLASRGREAKIQF